MNVRRCASFFHKQLDYQSRHHICKNSGVNSRFFNGRFYTEFTSQRREQLGVVERSDADDRLQSAENADLHNIFAQIERVFLKKLSSFFSRLKIVHKIYITHGCEQSGAAEQSDADDGLQGALDA